MGQPQFKPPRMEPFQPRMDQPEVRFRFKPPQRFEPIRNEPYREQFSFEQPYDQGAKFRNEPQRNEPYRPPQNRRNRFGYQNNDKQNYLRNGYDGQDRNAYNAPAYNIPERDVFDRRIDLEERNIGVESNPRHAQGKDLRDQILEVINQALGPSHRRAPRHPYRKPYLERIDREEWPRGFKIPNFTMFSGED